MNKFRISEKILFIIALAALCAFLLPMLAAGMYAVPCADDYSYGYEAHKVFTETGSVLSALLRAFKHIGEVYDIWQGTYSAVFLFSAQPAVFGEGLYCITAFVMLLSLTAGVFYICIELFSGVFSVSRYLSSVFACAAVIACTQLLPSPVQGFYWYNGAVFYTFFCGLSYIAFALGIKYLRKGKKVTLVFLCILCLILGGGNYVTALSCVIIGLSSYLLLLLLRDKRRRKLLLPLALLLIGFAISIAAPGNYIRQATVENRPGVFEAVLMSFSLCAEYSLRWFTLPLAGILLLLAPLMWKGAKESSFSFRCPLLVTLYSYCLLSAMFCPPIYALGNMGEFRLVNIIYFTYIIVFVINLFYWLGWISKKLGKQPESAKGAALLPLILCTAVCIGLSLLYVFKGGGFTSVSALSILRNGEAKAFKACADGRLVILKDKTVADAELDSYPTLPYLLYYDDITADPSDWKNTDIASFYGKNSVVLKDIGQSIPETGKTTK